MLVRLKKTLNRRVGDVVYYKWLIADLPSETVEALKWAEGTELEAEATNGNLVLRRVRRDKRNKTDGLKQH